MSLAPLAVFLDIDLALDELAVLAGPIIDATALRAGEFEKLILRHSESHYIERYASRQSSAGTA
jgi:hypothetical protein